MKRILSLMLAALLLAGCTSPAAGTGEGEAVKANADSGTGGAFSPRPALRTLAEPVYPEFPQQPVMPREGGAEEWEAYREAREKYTDALAAVRGENSGLSTEGVSSLNAFAARSTRLILEGHEGENAICSPLSLWSALALLAQCAGGDSRRQVLEAVGADSVEQLQEAVSHVWQTLYTDDGQSSLILANSIWLNGNLRGSYVQDTLDALAEKYYAGAYSLPMGTGEADRAVTAWVKEQTRGLIGGDRPVVETKPETLALLVSSLYYKAAWQNEFMPGRTEIDTFTDAAGQETKVDFMHRTENANFIRRDGYQAASLNTHLGEMVFVLPDEGSAPESLLENPEFLPSLEFSDKTTLWGEVRWSVPKFDVNSDLNLLEALADLGITDLLNRDKADLSALTDLDAFVSEAKQLARVKVDEEGVEAAAVTILEIDECCALPPVEPEVCVMDLDRPFLFVIRTQGMPLFVGVVNRV